MIPYFAFFRVLVTFNIESRRLCRRLRVATGCSQPRTTGVPTPLAQELTAEKVIQAGAPVGNSRLRGRCGRYNWRHPQNSVDGSECVHASVAILVVWEDGAQRSAAGVPGLLQRTLISTRVQCRGHLVVNQARTCTQHECHHTRHMRCNHTGAGRDDVVARSSDPRRAHICTRCENVRLHELIQSGSFAAGARQGVADGRGANANQATEVSRRVST